MPSRDPVRTERCHPIRRRRRSSTRSGLGPAPVERTWRAITAANQVAATASAITVPHAEPATPRSRPYTSTTSATTFTTLATATITSGVRVSCTPRRKPLPTRATISNGAPTAEIRR